MNAINYRVSLDMLDTLSQATIKAKKGDSACKIHISLAKHGKLFSIGEGCYATFNAKKSDGNFIYDNCTIEGDTIVYDFASSIDENGACQVSAIEGIVDCEVTLYNVDGAQLTSPRFTLFIDSVIYNGEEIASSPESDVLKGLITEARNTIDEMEDLIEQGGGAGGGGGTPNAVQFVPQELTEEQQAQARENINAVDADSIPEWAMQPNKPTYTKREVGLGNVDNVEQYSEKNPPPYPVTSVNGKKGAVQLSASDVGADASGTAASAVSEHNTSDKAHNDIRLLIEGLTTRLNALANSTDEDLDQMAELVAYIKSNKSLIDSITTSKVSVSDIIDNLTSNVSNKPLSAAQGVALKALIDALDTKKLDASALTSAINTALAQAKASGEFDGKNGTSVTIANITESTEDGGENIVTFSDGKTLTVKNGSKGKDGTSEPTIPEYWEEHLADKISTIKALQDEGGKDCFSFVVMADMHYPSNLGKNSPILAKRILDKCDIKYALCLGDTQTRSCHNTKELLLAENEAIEKMLSPIRDRLLQTEGNHDGAYGRLDRDGGGISNNDANGNLKEPADRETYVYNLTPAEMHSAIYRKVGLVGDVHFDESGSGYYVDDIANKVRYIVLNTQCNDYELQADGTVKYPKMWLFRFTQPQFDLVIEALNNIPSSSWGVVVAGHCPLTQEIGDRDVMIGVLNAYKNKTSYIGEYEGTAEGGAAYTNRAEPLPNNTTDTTKWVNDQRFSSSGISAQSGTTVSNSIPCKEGDTIRIKGVSLRSNTDRFQVTYTKADGSTGNGYDYWNATTSTLFSCVEENGVYVVTMKEHATYTTTGFRFAMPTPADASKVIVTVNEEIVEGDVSKPGYDAVSVNCDFSNAKGNLVGYFHGHIHSDSLNTTKGFPIVGTRSDAVEEYTEELRNERVAGTITEQSFNVFTVNKKNKTIYATKIGAGADREISY